MPCVQSKTVDANVSALRIAPCEEPRTAVDAPLSPRRGAGVVERGGLENRCGCKPTQGSNPCLSAKTATRCVLDKITAQLVTLNTFLDRDD